MSLESEETHKLVHVGSAIFFGLVSYENKTHVGRSHGLVKLHNRSNKYDPRVNSTVASLGISWAQFAKDHGWGAA